MNDLFSINGAAFSECRNYRYALWRIWDNDLPKVMFIGLNPSTANENTDDPTIRRVVRFAKKWACGGVYMMNLFACVTPYPEQVKNWSDPIGDNDRWLIDIAKVCNGQVVCAWGDFKVAKERAIEVKSMFFGRTWALVINKNGTPRHPLYVNGNITPILFNSDDNENTTNTK